MQKGKSGPVDLPLFVTAGALISAGLTEDVGPGLYAGVGARPIDFLSVAAELRAVLPSKATARDPVDAAKAVAAQPSFDFSNMSLLVVPCFHLSYFLGCAVGQVGVSIAQRRLLSEGAVGFGLGPRLGIEIPFADRFVAHAFGEALFATVPAQVSIESANALWRQSIVSGFFGAGLSFRFN